LIDLHNHILPGFDDGSPDLATSLEMARIAAADGIETIACTPHIMAGVYDNTATEIRRGISRLAEAIYDAGIRLDLVSGADIHLDSNLVAGFRTGQLLALNETRYFLLEPPEKVLPPRFEDFVLALIVAGFVPILTPGALVVDRRTV
jgi:protein-tyrosine phosphatase